MLEFISSFLVYINSGASILTRPRCKRSQGTPFSRKDGKRAGTTKGASVVSNAAIISRSHDITSKTRVRCKWWITRSSFVITTAKVWRFGAPQWKDGAFGGEGRQAHFLRRPFEATPRLTSYIQVSDINAEGADACSPVGDPLLFSCVGISCR